jgi:hypothetical protein
MAGELSHRLQESMINRRGPDPLAPRLPYKVQRAINREAAWGLTAAARAQAVGFVGEARIDAIEQVTERAMIAVDASVMSRRPWLRPILSRPTATRASWTIS